MGLYIDHVIASYIAGYPELYGFFKPLSKWDAYTRNLCALRMIVLCELGKKRGTRHKSMASSCSRYKLHAFTVDACRYTMIYIYIYSIIAFVYLYIYIHVHMAKRLPLPGVRNSCRLDE